MRIIRTILENNPIKTFGSSLPDPNMSPMVPLCEGLLICSQSRMDLDATHLGWVYVRSKLNVSGSRPILSKMDLDLDLSPMCLR